MITRSRWFAPLLRLSAVLAAIGSLTACGSGGDQSSPSSTSQEERVLVINQGSDILALDPYYFNESPTLAVLINIFNPLTDMSAQLELQPSLAVSWRNIQPTLWEFKLREGVRFHNGQPFDAQDVRYTILRARDWPKSRQAAEVGMIKEIQIIDPHTVHILTTAPDAILPARLISIYMLDKETSEAGVAEEGEAWHATHAIGTGPYRLKEWRKDEYVLLESNEDYWDGAPSVKAIKFDAVSKDTTRMAGFLSGGIDILGHVPVRDIDRVRNTPGFRVISQPSLRLIYLGLDVSRDQSPGVPGSPPNPLKDLRVRQAIYAGINEELIVDKIMNGQAKPASQLAPDSTTGFDPSIQREPYDPEKARRLLAEAGYADGFDVRLDAPNDRYVNDAEIASAIASQLAKIGIRVDVDARPKSDFFMDERLGQCSFFLLGWTNATGDVYASFDHLLHTLGKSIGEANTSTFYSNAQFDRLTETAASEFDPEKRNKLLQQAMRIVMHDLPHIPLHYQMDNYAISDEVDWSPRRDIQIRGIEIRWKDSP